MTSIKTPGHRAVTIVARCAFVVLLALIASSCSGSFSFSQDGKSVTEAAADFIESTAMSQRIDVDGLTGAVCEEPEIEDIGEVFRCTAESPMGDVEFEVEIEGEDRIFASPTNVVRPDFVSDYAASAVTQLNDSNGFGWPADVIDCGDRAVVLGANNEMRCPLTDPESGDVFDVVLTIDDVFSGDFEVEVVG